MFEIESSSLSESQLPKSKIAEEPGAAFCDALGTLKEKDDSSIGSSFVGDRHGRCRTEAFLFGDRSGLSIERSLVGSRYEYGCTVVSLTGDGHD